MVFETNFFFLTSKQLFYSINLLSITNLHYHWIDRTPFQQNLTNLANPRFFPKFGSRTYQEQKSKERDELEAYMIV
jgi:hypothetical protein